MKFTKLFLISTVMLLAVCGCRRIQSDLPEHTGKVEMKYLLGTWDEYYDDFEIDESRTWNILEEGIQTHSLFLFLCFGNFYQLKRGSGFHNCSFY